MELGPTSYVILGMLALGPRSGYDIKQLADFSTRHFWATSYGQIYPELRDLSEQGLVKAEDASKGTRQRTIYHLTPSGRKVLRAWVADPTIKNLEIRDEMLLKLFFADAMSPKETARHLEAMSLRHRQIAAGLREHEPMAAAQPLRMKYEVMKFGIGLHDWCAGWYARLAKDLEAGRKAK
jgi:PadR family transcriptional regulator AphA